MLALSAIALPVHAQEPAWQSAVQTLLDRRAAAVTAGDRRAFDATMRGAGAGFKRERLAWFARMQELPVESYELTLNDDEYLDLGPGVLRKPFADEFRVVVVSERFAFRGVDPVPTDDELILTVVRRGSRWSVVDDDDLEGLGFLTARNVWDFSDVEQVSSGRVFVLTQGSVRTARSIAADTQDAIRFVQRRWPLGWNGRVLVVIPRSTKELGRVLQTTFDLGPFVAFAAASVHRTRGSFDLVGNRVYVQPTTFFRSSESFQADTLTHELLHVASRDDSGAFVPAWLDEGVAQIFGERSVPGLADLARAVRAGRFTGRLPEDWRFNLGGRGEIRAAYQAGSDFIDLMRDRYGETKVGRFYDLLGAQKPVSFGTPRYHLDHAARRAFGRSFRSLERAWAASVRRRLG